MNIVFDFDSTILSIESLDYVLDSLLYKDNITSYNQIKKITDLGMNGMISIKESIEQRLKIYSLTRNDLESFAIKISQYITKGFEDLINELKIKKHKIFIVSGGFDILIDPVRKILDIPMENCFTNKFLFDSSGNISQLVEYPLLYQHGKTIILKELNLLNKETVMIGDGYTDLQVHLDSPEVYFICFTGNKNRNQVPESNTIPKLPPKTEEEENEHYDYDDLMEEGIKESSLEQYNKKEKKFIHNNKITSMQSMPNISLSR